MHKRLATGLLALAIGLAAPTAVAAKALPTKAQAALNAGLAAAQKQLWDVALKDFQSALNMAPTSAQIMFDLGLVNDKMGGHDLAAIAWLRAYLALEPNAPNAKAVAARAAALEAQEKAIERSLIKKAEAVNSQLPANLRYSGLEQIADAEADMGDYGVALDLVLDASNATLAGDEGATPFAQWTQTANANRDAAFADLAGHLAGSGHLGAATEAALRIKNANPYMDSRDNAWTNISQALANKGEFTKSAEYAAKANGPERVTAFLNLAEAQLAKQDRSGAKASMDRAENAWRLIPCAKWDCAAIAGELLQPLSKIEGIDAARRLYEEALREPSARNAGSRSNLLYHFVSALIDVGDLRQARAFSLRIPNLTWRKMALTDVNNAQKNVGASHGNAAYAVFSADLARAFDLEGAKKAGAAAARIPRDVPTFYPLLKLAALYRGFGDAADSDRVLASLQAQIARQRPSGQRAIFQIALAQAFAQYGLNSQADALVNRLGLARLLPALLRQKFHFQAQSVSTTLANLAGMQEKSGDVHGARISALQAITIANRLNRYFDVATQVCSIAPAVGLVAQCEAFIRRTANASDRARLKSDLVLAYEAPRVLGKAVSPASIAKIKALVARIPMADRPYNLLTPLLSRLEVASNWSAAASLVAETHNQVYYLANQMLDAGRLDLVKSIEPLLVTSNSMDSYREALSRHLAADGRVNQGLRALLQVNNIKNCRFCFYDLAKTVFNWSGLRPPNVTSAIDAAFQRTFSPANCWFEQNIIPTSESAWGDPNAVATKKCLEQRAIYALANAQWQCCAPGADLPAPLRAPYHERRFWLDTDIVAKSNASNVNDRQGADRAELYALYADGATETADILFAGHPNVIASDAVTRLAEDDPADARRLAERLVAKAAAMKPKPDVEWEKDAATKSAVNRLVQAGDLADARALLSKVHGRSYYLQALVNVASLAVKTDPGGAGPLLEQEYQFDRVQNYEFELSGVAAQAATLGLHPLAEEALAGFYTAEPSSWCDANYQYPDIGYIEGLLRHGDQRLALARLKIDLARFGSLTPTQKAGCGPRLAEVLAWTGQGDALEHLLKSAPDPAFLARALRGAAKGYARAGKPDAARQSLQRALAALKATRPDAEAWSAALIAEAQDEVDPAGAEKAALAISDPAWRARAIAGIAKRRFAAGDFKGAAAILLDSAPLQGRVLDQPLARAARWLFGQGENVQGRALIERIAGKTLRDATWGFCILSRARQKTGADPFNDVDKVENIDERVYLLTNLGVLLQAQKRDDLAQKALEDALPLTDKIKDPLVAADAAFWVFRVASGKDAQFMKAAYANASALAQKIADPSERMDMLKFEALPTPDLSRRAMLKTPSLLAKSLAIKVETEASQYTTGLGYSTGLGDPAAFERSLASKEPPQIVSELTQAAINRWSSIVRLRGLVKGWSEKPH